MTPEEEILTEARDLGMSPEKLKMLRGPKMFCTHDMQDDSGSAAGSIVEDNSTFVPA